jgi:hypothetical protein
VSDLIADSTKVIVGYIPAIRTEEESYVLQFPFVDLSVLFLPVSTAFSSKSVSNIVQFSPNFFFVALLSPSVVTLASQ